MKSSQLRSKFQIVNISKTCDSTLCKAGEIALSWPWNFLSFLFQFYLSYSLWYNWHPLWARFDSFQGKQLHCWVSIAAVESWFFFFLVFLITWVKTFNLTNPTSAYKPAYPHDYSRHSSTQWFKLKNVIFFPRITITGWSYSMGFCLLVLAFSLHFTYGQFT